MDGSSIIDSIHRLDQEITLFINCLDTAWTDQFWLFMSDKLVWAPAYLLCILFLRYHLGWKKAAIIVCTALLGFLICDQFSNFSKNAVGRLRPNYSSEMILNGLSVLEKRAGKFGFFSAHAANSFSLAVCLTMGFRNDSRQSYRVFAAGAITWASLVSLSRIFVGKHYLGDVLVGIAVGIAVGYAMGRLGRWAIGKFFGSEVTKEEVPDPTESPELSPS